MGIRGSDFAIKHEIRHQAGGFQLRNPIPDLFFVRKSEIRNCKTFLLIEQRKSTKFSSLKSVFGFHVLM